MRSLWRNLAGNAPVQQPGISLVTGILCMYSQVPRSCSVLLAGPAGYSYLLTRKSVCHHPQLMALMVALGILTSHGAHSCSLTLQVPSWRNLFQPHVKAVPPSVSTAQCLAPL